MAESVLDPMERDTYNLVPEWDVLGDLYPDHSGPMFLESELVKPDLEPLLQGIPENVRLQILHWVQIRSEHQ